MTTDTKLTLGIVTCVVVLVLAFVINGKQSKPGTPGAQPGASVEPNEMLVRDPDGIMVPAPDSDFMQAVSNEEGFRMPADLDEAEQDYLDRLKRLVPAEVGGFTLAGAEFGIAGSDRVRIPGAQTHFKNADGDVLTLAIVDVYALNRSAKRIGIYTTPEEIDREDDLSIKRTFEHMGYTGTQEYDKKTENLRIEVMVEERYLVSVQAEGLSLAQGLGYLQLLPVDVLPRLQSFAID